MTLIEKSNNSLKLFKAMVQATTALGCISGDVFNTLYDRVSFLNKLVDSFDLNGPSSELKILYSNYKTAHNILCDIDEKIHKGVLFKYEYNL